MIDFSGVKKTLGMPIPQRGQALKPITIGIEATLAGAPGAERHGIYRYLQQILLGFKKIGAPHRFRLWFNAFRKSKLIGIPEFLAEIDWPHLEAVVSRFPFRLRQSLSLPIDRSIGLIDLFHSPNHLLPRLRRGKSVVTIHDLAFFKMSESLSQLNSKWCEAIQRFSPHPMLDLSTYRSRCDYFLMLQKKVPETLARADRIIAVSEATARDLLELAKISEAKVRVVLNGLTPGLSRVKDEGEIKQTLAKFGIAGEYVLFVGVLDPNKDLHTLIAAFALCTASFRRHHHLVIVGPRNWFQPVLEEESSCLGVRERVHFTGFVSDELLPAFYSGATVSVSPSPLEGFGFPAIESMACGTPVIVANSGGLPEVAGEAAIRVPPKDPHALAAEIERISGDPGLVADLSNRGLARC
jgi:glycosyltransferase involved in cell wall biosynthesis